MVGTGDGVTVDVDRPAVLKLPWVVAGGEPGPGDMSLIPTPSREVMPYDEKMRQTWKTCVYKGAVEGTYFAIPEPFGREDEQLKLPSGVPKGWVVETKGKAKSATQKGVSSSFYRYDGEDNRGNIVFEQILPREVRFEGENPDKVATVSQIRNASMMYGGLNEANLRLVVERDEEERLKAVTSTKPDLKVKKEQMDDGLRVAGVINQTDPTRPGVAIPFKHRGEGLRLKDFPEGVYMRVRMQLENGVEDERYFTRVLNPPEDNAEYLGFGPGFKKDSAVLLREVDQEELPKNGVVMDLKDVRDAQQRYGEVTLETLKQIAKELLTPKGEKETVDVLDTVDAIKELRNQVRQEQIISASKRFRKITGRQK